MKKKITKLYAIAFVYAILFSSCAFHVGNMTGSTILSTNNFKYIKFVKGEAKTIKLFGIGGLEKEALIAEAKNDLIQKYPLKDGQALANITIDFKTTLKILIIETKVTITADIVEFK